MLRKGKAISVFEDRLRQLTKTANAILDIGTSQRFAKELRPYESWFDGRTYIAAGFNPSNEFGPYNCDVNQDIESMTFSDESFDGLICLEVLEHVRNPFKAVSEIRRVLRTGALLLLTVPFLTQYHGKGGASHKHSEYPDFWRFTHQGLELLFSDFNNVEVIPLDGPIEFRLKQFYLQRLIDSKLGSRLVDWLDNPRLGKATTRHLVFAQK